MEKPKWNLETETGRREMAEWLDFMLDSGAIENLDADDEAYTDAHLPKKLTVAAPAKILERLKLGIGSVKDQQWAARELEKNRSPALNKRGRPPQNDMEKNSLLMSASDEVRTIQSIWKREFERNDLQRAIEFAVFRWVQMVAKVDDDQEALRNELEQNVHDNLNRSRDRLQSWEKNYRP